MEYRKVHCLFEQSGTFKNEFKKLGYDAIDYDIQNEFGQTDVVCDLFENIKGGYEGKPSIFDDMTQDDLIMAFFPCIRFENQIMLWFRGQSASQKKWDEIRKMEFCMKLLSEVKEMYDLVNKMFIICKRRNLKIVMENPFSEEHFLRRYWCITPKIIDKDRRERGDYYPKPTQYWFLNTEPKNNFIFEVVNDNSLKIKNAIANVSGKDLGVNSTKTARSMIHPDYANRFIREYLIDYQTNIEELLIGE